MVRVGDMYDGFDDRGFWICVFYVEDIEDGKVLTTSISNFGQREEVRESIENLEKLVNDGTIIYKGNDLED